MLCSRCKKRPAVVFMTRMEGEKSVNEGLCLVCAKELGLKPIDDLMKRFGISDEDLEAFSEQFAMPGDEGSMENGDGADFESGGSPTFPNFFQNILGNMNKQPEVDGDDNTNQKQSR
ncbi:MAG: ATP-dependent Clp protease ATP-binding subunit, partial [Oscillospiraceae bacterium]